jgi:hypothetical protein
MLQFCITRLNNGIGNMSQMLHSHKVQVTMVTEALIRVTIVALPNFLVFHRP